MSDGTCAADAPGRPDAGRGCATRATDSPDGANPVLCLGTDRPARALTVWLPDRRIPASQPYRQPARSRPAHDARRMACGPTGHSRRPVGRVDDLSEREPNPPARCPVSRRRAGRKPRPVRRPNREPCAGRHRPDQDGGMASDPLEGSVACRRGAAWLRWSCGRPITATRDLVVTGRPAAVALPGSEGRIVFGRGTRRGAARHLLGRQFAEGRRRRPPAPSPGHARSAADDAAPILLDRHEVTDRQRRPRRKLDARAVLDRPGGFPAGFGPARQCRR